MFGDKEGVINEPHRRAESRMESSAGKDRRIGSSQELDELATRGPKGCQKLGEMARVVIRLVSPSVRQIGRSKLGLTCEELFRAAAPQGLQVEEMPGVLLRGPLAIVTPRQNIGAQRAHALLEPRGGTSESLKEAREAINWHIEIERTFKPLLSRH